MGMVMGKLGMMMVLLFFFHQLLDCFMVYGAVIVI